MKISKKIFYSRDYRLGYSADREWPKSLPFMAATVRKKIFKPIITRKREDAGSVITARKVQLYCHGSLIILKQGHQLQK